MLTHNLYLYITKISSGTTSLSAEKKNDIFFKLLLALLQAVTFFHSTTQACENNEVI